MVTVLNRLSNKAEIRSRLNRDREWSLYALADLDQGMFEHCDWWSIADGLALVFRAMAIRPIFVMGDAQITEMLLTALPEGSGYLNLKPHQLKGAERVYRYRVRHEMQRMFLDSFQPRSGPVEVLDAKDHRDIERLYSTGEGGGISFASFQLDTGFFRGVRRNGELVAVAGVQVLSRKEGVAAVGNIYTRPDYRGQGFAHVVTSAVVRSLIEAGIATIGLNVEKTNTTAIRVYENIGFRTHFSYFEGTADKISAKG
jgi:ribosomal protein S18 acetylase RimI-like enzyme